jgi:hypothetical protein
MGCSAGKSLGQVDPVSAKMCGEGCVVRNQHEEIAPAGYGDHLLCELGAMRGSAGSDDDHAAAWERAHGCERMGEALVIRHQHQWGECCRVPDGEASCCSCQGQTCTLFCHP